MEEVLLRGLLKLATNRHVRLPTWQMDAYGGLASGKTWKDKTHLQQPRGPLLEYIGRGF